MTEPTKDESTTRGLLDAQGRILYADFLARMRILCMEKVPNIAVSVGMGGKASLYCEFTGMDGKVGKLAADDIAINELGRHIKAMERAAGQAILASMLNELGLPMGCVEPGEPKPVVPYHDMFWDADNSERLWVSPEEYFNHIPIGEDDLGSTRTVTFQTAMRLEDMTMTYVVVRNGPDDVEWAYQEESDDEA